MGDTSRYEERHVRLMALALDLAARGPAADPNPRVGAVILDADGAVVGQGFHAGAGTPHAEALALTEAGERARGGSAYITLEPCAHTGRTGPCTELLLKSGVHRVVYAQPDPNPTAAGGHARLAAAGLVVENGLGSDDAAALNRRWSYAVGTGRPFVTWKYAATLDGCSAAVDGTSQWITGSEARDDVHDLRAQHAAILVGTGTALADDPQLTVRYADGSRRARQPLRVVMGLRDLPPDARVLDDAAPTLHARTHEPGQLLAVLHARHIRSVWLEGGPTLAAAFLRAGLVDEVVAYLAPTLLGAGRPAVGHLAVATLADRYDLKLRDVRAFGSDLRIVATPAGAHAAGGTCTQLAEEESA